MEIEDIVSRFENNYSNIDNDIEDEISTIAIAIYDILDFLKERLPIDSKK